MERLKPVALDLTGRQRSLWGQVLRRLDADGLLLASLPEGLTRLPPGSPPQDWIEQAESGGQVLPWLLRLLALRPQDPTLHVLARDLGLCVDSRERLQSSAGWRHWSGLESAAQSLSLRLGPGALSRSLSGGGPETEPPARSLVLAGWTRRLLCLWTPDPPEPVPPVLPAVPPSAGCVPRQLVLDLGGGQLLPLDDAAGDSPLAGQLAALPCHALDAPLRSEARLRTAREAGEARVRCHEGLMPWPPAGGNAVSARVWSERPASPLLRCAQLGRPQAGPVLLLGADPGRPPQLCLALLEGRGAAWFHDACPAAMAGGGLCLDLDGRLLGVLRPMNTANGRGLALLWS